MARKSANAITRLQTAHQRLLADPRMPVPLKAQLEATHATLDPVRLLCEIRSAQEQLMGIADKTSAPDASPAEGRAGELEAFLAGLKHAWKGGEVRPIARPKPMAPRGRRRPDPLKDVTEELKSWHATDPDATGRQLLERLQATYPGRHPDGLLRTVQRRLKIWRSDQARALVFGARASDATTTDRTPGERPAMPQAISALQTSSRPRPTRSQREPT